MDTASHGTAAQEKARTHLRAKQSLVWNATCLTLMMREKQVRLFEGYCVFVRIIHLEPGWEENLRRNANRRAAVPEPIIEKMLGNLTPPERWDARRVEWVCV